jgi:biopolymer transport protein ExbD
MRLRMRGHGRRKGGGGDGHGPLSLVPMIDMLTIMVVYLLVHAADYEILPQTKAISIPLSISEAKPRESVVMLASQDAIYVNGAAVTSLDVVQRAPENVVPALKTALQRAAAADTLLSHSGSIPREVTIMADKGLPYATLRKLMATATAASYSKVSLAVIEKERARRPG